MHVLPGGWQRINQIGWWKSIREVEWETLNRKTAQ
jgi:hypothetical protein